MASGHIRIGGLFIVLALIIGSLEACLKPRNADLLLLDWQVQDSGTAASIRGISAVSESVCWFSGSGGTVARTTDGGATWESQPVTGYEALDFRDIQAFDADTALVLSAGRPGTILKTTDGGRSWLEAYSDDREGVFFNSMAFWDDLRGLAVGDPRDGRFLLIYTVDGGRTWAEVPFADRPQALEGEAGFAASGTCLAVSEGGLAWFGTGGGAARVGRSEDYGIHWLMNLTPQLCGQATQGIFSLDFRNGREGVLVGGDYQSPSITEHVAALTVDGGKTWTPVPSDGRGTGGYRSCVAFLPGSASITIAMGKEGADYSLNGGKVWTAILLDDYYYCLSISKQGKAGWAAGPDGRIARFLIRIR